MKIIISNFLLERAKKDGCLVDPRTLLPEIYKNWENRKQADREGIYYVEVGKKNFRSAVVELEVGDELVGTFQRRAGNEKPRKLFGIKNKETLPITGVEAVIYSREVLAENGENSEESADYEVITFLGKVNGTLPPRNIETLLANHFQDDGGTATGYSNEVLIEKLKESYFFWKNKAPLIDEE